MYKHSKHVAGRIALTGMLACCSVGTVARAQSSPNIALSPSGELALGSRTGEKDDKETASIALFESFSTPGVSAVVRRTKGNSGKVLVAIKRSALSPELLNAIFTSIPNSKRSVRATSARADLYFRETRQITRVKGARLAEMTELISELLAAPPRLVPGLGEHPTITREF